MTYKSIDTSFIYRKGNRVIPTKESYNAYKNKSVGKAYGFFYCNASKEAIESELPTIRKMVKTPSNLELTLIKGINWDSNFGKELQTLSTQSLSEGHKRSKMFSAINFLKAMSAVGNSNYSIQAEYSGATNQEAADEVAGILNQAYQSPLYKDKGQFRGEVVYEDKGEYVFRR
jgi:hypothetical protein